MLSASELRYRRLFESAQDGILLLDYETGMITDVNQFLITLLGYSKKDFLGKHIWEIGPFKDIVATKENLVTLQENKYIRYEDMPLQTNKGHIIEIEFIANVYTVDGVSVIQCSIRDITERKNAERLKDKALGQTNQILNTVREPLLLLNEDMTVMMANEIFYKNFMVNQKDTIGKNLFDLGNGQWAISKLKQLLEDILPQKTHFIDFLVTHEFEQIGHKVMLISGKEFIRESGKAKMIILAIRDITTENTAKNILLSASELRYRRLFESAQDGILLLDYETGMITDVNQFLITLLGYSKKDFLGKHIWEIGPFKDIVATKDIFTSLQKKKYIRYEDMPLQTNKGHIIEVEFIANTYLVDSASVIQCSIRDITDRINAEKMLNEINVLKDNFLMTASHELKSPLVPIKSQSEILLDGDYGNLNQNQKNAIEMIDRNEKKLERVANGIVDLSKIQSGRLSLYRRKTNIIDLVAREIAEIKYRAQNNKISIINNTPSTIPNLIIDKFRIEKVVNIILDNAIKFTPKKGSITVKTIKERNYVILSITDTGVGISAKNMKKLFTPFYRVDFELNRKNIGSGLGLAIARGIVNAHGGKIWVESKGKDKGCSFYVKLPINKLKGTENYDNII